MKRNPSFLPPVILIGMHRSGTSLICRVLEELGLFVGNKLERNHEAWFFLRINEWIFRQGGAAWDNPEVLDHLLINQDLRELVSGRMRDILHSPRVMSYLGLRRYLRCSSIPSINFPWGWKDPRNTFTLPLWQEIFPQAKIIHIYRHGVDVAESLRVRCQRDIEKGKEVSKKWGRQIRRGYRPPYSLFTLSARCFDLSEGFSLWEQYIRRAGEHTTSAGENGFSIKYENFLENPLPILEKLAHFCGLPVSSGKMQSVMGKLRSERAMAFTKNPRLIALSEQKRDILTEYGY